MRLLILTQKIDIEDPILGFFHKWVYEFSKKYESVVVICLEKGKYDLPKNVKVLSLGKESRVSKVGYLVSFSKYIFKFRKEYDSVFVHMNPIYVVLGGLFWRLSNKYVMMWYTHRQVDFKLRIATMFSNVVFTASKYSFRINTKKREIIGHGIDVKKFECRSDRGLENIFRIIVVGRITKIKNCISSIYLADVLKASMQTPIELQFIGGTSSRDDEAYFHEMKRLINSLKLNENVKFVGNVPHDDITKYYCNANLAINMSPDGGMDKAVLEAIASKTPIIVKNEAFREHLGKYANDIMCSGEDSQEFAEKVLTLHASKDREEMLRTLQQKVYDEFGVEGLVGKIVKKYESR